jgi:hypothetical protein
MKSAINPDNACACVPPGTAPKATIPINRFDAPVHHQRDDGAKVVPGARPCSKASPSTAATASPMFCSTDGGKV